MLCRLRDLNDEINKLIREKGHWERRIVELGGPDYAKSAPKVRLLTLATKHKFDTHRKSPASLFDNRQPFERCIGAEGPKGEELSTQACSLSNTIVHLPLFRWCRRSHAFLCRSSVTSFR